MSQTFTAALIQMRSGRTPAQNVEAVAAMAREAVAAGAHYIQTPEMTSIIERDREAMLSVIGTEESDASLAAFRQLARELKVWLHIGSQPIRLPATDRMVNRSFVLTPEGEIFSRYDKIHMFDVDLPHGESWRESNNYKAGEDAVVAELPWGGLGLTICYDLRFPALHRALAEAGALFLASPAAFTRQTGEAHWHVLLRARAIETGSFVLAAAQGGVHEDRRETYGHSLIIDPWGRILAEGGTEPGVIFAKIDPAEVPVVRQRIPALKHGRRFTVENHNMAAEHGLKVAK